jgi:two-component system response regulator
MPHSHATVSIVLADDDPDDRLMAREAFDEGRILNPLDMVEDGEELLNYLRYEGAYAGRVGELPGLILLDLNMPRMDGRQALAIIKADPQLRRIPVVVLTTSKAEEDLIRSYDLGVNSFCVKPVTFDGLVDLVRSLGHYWLSVVQLAPNERN